MNGIKYCYEKINRQMKRVAGLYGLAAGRAGLTDGELMVWTMLMCCDEALSQQEISGVMEIPKRTVSSVVANLVKNEYAYFELAPQPRGKKKVRLTDSGMRYGRERLGWIFEAEKSAFERMGEEDMQRCAALLDRYVLLLDEEINAKEANK